MCPCVPERGLIQNVLESIYYIVMTLDRFVLLEGEYLLFAATSDMPRHHHSDAGDTGSSACSVNVVFVLLQASL